MNEPATGEPLKGRRAITADGVDLGVVDAETETHLRVHAEDSDAPDRHLWLPKEMVDQVAAGTVSLNRRRADLHDAVFSLPPGQQREYATLEPTVKIGRERWLKM
jgi:hypothetical protein